MKSHEIYVVAPVTDNIVWLRNERWWVNPVSNMEFYIGINNIGMETRLYHCIFCQRIIKSKKYIKKKIEQKSEE